jgi:hypothetical protein
MATAAYAYPTANATIAIASSSQNWANQGNIYASDNSDADTASPLTSAQFTNYLVAKGFNFTLPNDAIVTGIQVRIEKEGAHIFDKHVYLTLDGAAVVGDDKKVAGVWAGSDTKVVHGGTTDEWGLRLTGADVNRCTFGACLACTADATGDTPQVDGVEIQLTYTDPTEVLTTSSDVRRERDIYRLLGKWMADKHTTKQFTILQRNGIHEVTLWSF